VKQPTPIGHEYVGVVEAVGGDVTTVRPGQFVVGGFLTSDNTSPSVRPAPTPTARTAQATTGARQS
jgi:threonine dehydrogenase-like Zn-dependent dehydrogenase